MPEGAFFTNEDGERKLEAWRNDNRDQSKRANKKLKGGDMLEWSIEFYKSGVLFNGGSKRQDRPEGAGGKRGEIKGWSSASRRRFRKFLMFYGPRTASKLVAPL